MNIDTNEVYGNLMLNSIITYKKQGTVTSNLVKTIRFIRENLYTIDQNPRMATLALYLEYNLPLLKDEVSFIWDNLFTFQKYESQLNTL